MSEFGINHFWVQLDWVGRTLAVLLLGMSLVTWALLLGWVLEGLIGFMRRNRAPAAAVPTDIELAPPSGGHHEAALLGEVQAALRRRAFGKRLGVPVQAAARGQARRHDGRGHGAAEPVFSCL